MITSTFHKRLHGEMLSFNSRSSCWGSWSQQLRFTFKKLSSLEAEDGSRRRDGDLSPSYRREQRCYGRKSAGEPRTLNAPKWGRHFENLLKVLLDRPLSVFQAMHPGVAVGGRAFSLSIFLFILQPMEAPQGEYLKFIGILISCGVAVIDLFLWKHYRVCVCGWFSFIICLF